MLSFNSLGNLGRLGNQMFQYSALKGIASHHGYDFCIPPKSIFGQYGQIIKESDENIYDVFPNVAENKITLARNVRVPEVQHTFDCHQFETMADNCDLFGYYQTEKYFVHIEDEIRKDFTFKPELTVICTDFIKSNFDTEVISLHIRRGDYLENPNHPIQDLLYYQTALSKLPDIPVIIFSDDPEWVYNQELFVSDRYSISDNNSTSADLCLMSMCNYHIIANSSFSWWGAWLGRSKKVIAPTQWFGGSCVNKSVKDLKFGNWEWIHNGIIDD